MAHRPAAERVAADLERDPVLDSRTARAYGLLDHVLENRDASCPPQNLR